VDSGIIKLLVFLVIAVFYVIKVVANRSKEQKEEERRQAAAKPKSAPEPGAAASAPGKGTAATEVDRFLEELARQSGVPVPPRQPAPLPKPPVIVAPPPKPKAPAPAARAPAPAEKPHAPVAVRHAPATRPQPTEVVAIVEPEPVVELPAMEHLSPLAQAIVLREVLGPCRALKPWRNRPRRW
jgi:hypothetical protein